MLFQNQKKFLRSLEQGDESDIYPESKSVEKYLVRKHFTFRSLIYPSLLPLYFTQGLTYLIPKSGDLRNTENNRPITCLPTAYKVLTAVITIHINKHLRTHNLVAPEQGGGRIKTKGYK